MDYISGYVRDHVMSSTQIPPGLGQSGLVNLMFLDIDDRRVSNNVRITGLLLVLHASMLPCSHALHD